MKEIPNGRVTAKYANYTKILETYSLTVDNLNIKLEKLDSYPLG